MKSVVASVALVHCISINILTPQWMRVKKREENISSLLPRKMLINIWIIHTNVYMVSLLIMNGINVVLYYAAEVFGGQCHASAVINWQSQNKMCMLILFSTLADVHSLKCIITNHYIFHHQQNINYKHINKLTTK